MPGFFLSLLLIYLFTVKLGWLPSSGMATLGTAGGAGDVAKHMVMPVLVLATSMAGTNIRYIRSAMLEILQQDYLRTAKAKGIGRFLVINKHALRNALIPIITVIGMEIPVLFGGQVIIEQVFSWRDSDCDDERNPRTGIIRLLWVSACCLQSLCWRQT